MGRVKQPLDNDGPAATFAAMLRAQRTVAGTPPYRAMASHTGWAHTTLSLADNGDRLPTWPCTQAYLRACEVSDAAMRWWHDRWTEAVDGIALRKAVVAASRTPRHARESLREPDGLIHVANRGELLRLLDATVRRRATTWPVVAGRIHSRLCRRDHPDAAGIAASVADGQPDVTDQILVEDIITVLGGGPLDVYRWGAACGRVRHTEYMSSSTRAIAWYREVRERALAEPAPTAEPDRISNTDNPVTATVTGPVIEATVGAIAGTVVNSTRKVPPPPTAAACDEQTTGETARTASRWSRSAFEWPWREFETLLSPLATIAGAYIHTNMDTNDATVPYIPDQPPRRTRRRGRHIRNPGLAT